MTLLFSLILLIGAGILVFSGARTSVMEQRITTNEQQSIELRQAAQAGLDYAYAWLDTQVWMEGDPAPNVPDLPGIQGDSLRIELQFSRDNDAICVRSRASAARDPDAEAIARECFIQTGLFDIAPETRMPPPLVFAGCWDSPPEPAELRLLDATSTAFLSGGTADSDCLPSGSLTVGLWQDREDADAGRDRDRIMTLDEQGETLDPSEWRRARISGCPGEHCVWKQVFALSLDAALQRAETAGHVFDDRIPCGATEAPGIYRIDLSGAIDAARLSGVCTGAGVDSRTIGTPNRPVLLIVPSASGCPRFGPDIRIYGIVYYESSDACAAQGWGGARIQGAVLWEGDAQAPEAGSVLIETDWGTGSALNARFRVIEDAIRVPGAWRDW